jgi:putative transposase
MYRSCGYVDKKNRKDTQEFECKACGNKTNVQVNGAKNIFKRSSLGSLHLTKKQVLNMLTERYLERQKGARVLPWMLLKVIHTLRIILIAF